MNWWKFTSKIWPLSFKWNSHKTCCERRQTLSALGKWNSLLCCGPAKLWNVCDLLDVKMEIKWCCNSMDSALSALFLNFFPPLFLMILFWDSDPKATSRVLSWEDTLHIARCKLQGLNKWSLRCQMMHLKTLLPYLQASSCTAQSQCKVSPLQKKNKQTSKPTKKPPQKPKKTQPKQKKPIKKPTLIQQTFQWSCPRQLMTLFRNGLTGENWCDGFPRSAGPVVQHRGANKQVTDGNSHSPGSNFHSNHVSRFWYNYIHYDFSI